jgi:hypothetical protein
MIIGNVYIKGAALLGSHRCFVVAFAPWHSNAEGKERGDTPLLDSAASGRRNLQNAKLSTESCRV